MLITNRRHHRPQFAHRSRTIFVTLRWGTRVHHPEFKGTRLQILICTYLNKNLKIYVSAYILAAGVYHRSPGPWFNFHINNNGQAHIKRHKSNPAAPALAPSAPSNQRQISSRDVFYVVRPTYSARSYGGTDLLTLHAYYIALIRDLLF